MADETVILGIKIDTREIEKANIKLNDLKSAANGADKATGELSTAYKDMKATLDPLFAIQRQYSHGLKLLKEEQKRGTLAAGEAEEMMAKLYQRQKLLTEQVTGANKSFRGLRGAAQNLGWQLQDVAVQAQAGTDAFVIFSQQGSQIASAFGPGGAILGAIIAVGGAIGGALVNSMMEAKEETKKLTEEMEKFNDEIESIIASTKTIQLRKIDSDLEKIGGRITSIQEEIKKIPNIELIRREELDKLFLAQKTLLEQRNELLRQDSSGDVNEKRIDNVNNYVEALEMQVWALGKSEKQIELEKAAKLGANAIDLVRIGFLLDEVEAYKKAEKARKDALKAQREALKESVREQKEQDKAFAEAKKNYEQMKRTYQGIIDKLDPMATKFRNVAKQQKFLIDNQHALGLSTEQLDTLLEKLNATLDNSKDKGDSFQWGEEFGLSFAQGFESVSSTIGESLVTGDWDGVGRDIGGSLASSIGSTISTGVTNALSGLGSFAGPIGGIVGGLAGGILSSIGQSNLVDPTEKRQSSQGTGSILGSINEKSESIVNSLDIVASATSELVNINTGMLNTLKNVDTGVKNAFTQISKSDFSKLFSKSDFIDVGVSFLGGSLEQLASNTIAGGFGTFGLLDGKTRNVDIGTDARISQAFTQVFDNIKSTVEEGADVLGVELGNTLNKVYVDAQNISLQGLDATAQQAEIEAVFSKIFDNTVNNALPFLSEMQKAGEGLAETLSRVTTGFELSEEAATALGFSFRGTTEEIIKASDNLISSVGGLEAFNTAVVGFEGNFLSVEEQLTNKSRRLNEALSSIGESLPETRQGFRDLVLGLDATSEADAEALATILQLQGVAADYYSQLESSLEDTADAIDTVVDAVARLQANVDSAASASDLALNKLKEAVNADKQELIKSYNIAVQERKDQLKEEIKGIKEAGKSRATAIKNAEKDRLRANKLALDAAKDGLKAITKELNGIISALDKLTEQAVSGERRRAEALLLLNNALLTGDLTGTGEASGIAANLKKADFATGEDYRRQVGVTRSVLSQLEDSGEAQKSNAELTIERLEEQNELIKSTADAAIAANQANTNASIVAAELRAEEDLLKLEEQHKEDIAKLDLIIDNAVAQLDALRGIDSSVMSVEAAVSAFGSALNAEREARASLEAELAAEKASNTVDAVNNEFPDLLAAIAQNGVDLGPRIDPNAIATFADGGSHSGGLRLVGEEGPELEVTGPSRIMSNNDLMSALTGEQTAEQIRQLREDMNQVLTTMAFDIRKVTKRVDRWEGDGLPNFREVQQVETV